MANGKPSDPEDFVIRSGVRSGLKREFAFALKSQAELASSLGGGRSRTRSGKPPSSTPTPPPPRRDPNKRLKKSSSASPLPTADSPLPAAADKIKPPPPEPKEEEQGEEDESAKLMHEEEEEPVVEDPSVHQGSQVDSHAAAPVELVVEETSPSPTPRPPSVDANDVPNGSGDSLMEMEMEMEMVIDLPYKVVSGGTVEDEPIPKTPVPESSTADKLRIEDSVAVGSPPTPTRLVVDNVVESPLTVVTKVEVIGVPPEKPTKRFTRSSLNVGGSSSGVENPVVVNVDPKGTSYLPEKPARRFTRSLLKAPAKEYSAEDVSATTTSGGSVGSDETKGGANADDGSSTMTPSKKMELKMSKKIALNKFPSNVRDLLGTGLLEGYPVKYLVYVGKQYGLEGVIKGNGILCSCNFCKGSRVVSAYNFEMHAGSTKKHPSDYIFLENGKSLRDVLKACTSAPLDMLESAIQNAAGAVPPSKPSTCHKCKGSFHTPRTGKFALICDTCLEAPRQTTTKPLQGTPSNAKFSTKVLTGDASCGSYKKTSSQKKSILPMKHLSEDASDSSSMNTSQKKIMGKLTRKDLGLHKLVFMDDILPEGTEVGYYVRGQKLLEGYIKDSGICCQCCDTVVSPSQFEAHAGRAQRRKPYNNIYTSNGVSLHELSVSLSKDRKMSASENDDLCSICADGGDLLLCDLCPRAFHKECVGLSSVPKGDWYCRYCHDMHHREKCLSTNDNAIAAGRVAGVDPIEQIINRCIRIVTKSTDIGGCSLCRSHDFSRSGFGDRTVILCDQCEKEYHVGCMKDHNMCDLKELPEGEWFCSTDCSRIHASLQELLLEPKALQDMHADIIKKKCEEKGVNKDNDVRWRLLSGKTCPPDAKLLLSEAVTIFHESFDPIVDAVTGRDLIPSMVYGREVRDQDFGGMYCAVLTVNSSVVSAGILRVLGCEVAELPLVATSRDSQGLGYFQSLFSCIEKLLGSLKVKHFVLPSADEAKSIWTKKFGFSKITPDQFREYAKGAHPMVFQGTSLLYKPVP